MLKIRFIILSLTIISLSGCSALTETQRKTVSNYAKLTQGYTKYPSEVAKAYLGFGYEAVIVPIGFNQPDASKVYGDLEAQFAVFQKGNKEAQRIDDGINVLRQYAKSLEALASIEISDGFAKNAEIFGKTLDDAVTEFNTRHSPATPLPTGFGKLAGDAIALIGKRYINHKQAKALQNYMQQGNNLIGLIKDDVEKAFKNLNSKWPDQKKNLIGQYTASLGQMRQGGTQGSNVFYTYQFNKEMLSLIERIDAFEKLLSDTPKAMTGVLDAHKKVSDDIMKKRSIKNQIADLTQLYKDVTTLQSEFEKLTNKSEK